jgi:hypothetical protein
VGVADAPTLGDPENRVTDEYGKQRNDDDQEPSCLPVTGRKGIEPFGDPPHDPLNESFALLVFGVAQLSVE